MTSYGCFKYEVFGKVQRVFFRKYTQQKAAELGIVGWVMNTARGTVVGEAQGEAAKLREFRKWLQKTGSPKSKIDRAEFKEERLDLGKEDLTYKDFELRS